MSDKKISDLQQTGSISPDFISVLVNGDVDYKYTFAQLITFMSANLTVGAKISAGTAAPVNTSGSNGDLYIKTDSQQFFLKISGTWSVIYTVSATSQLDGTVLYGTATPPVSDLGNNGDSYVNTNTGVFYKKSSGTWSQVFAMADGPPGPRGNSILNGAIDPTNGVGVNGDFYINTVTEFIFGPKASGVWPSGVSIKGLDGNSVLSGTSNPLNSLGKNGDFYLNYGSYLIFGPKTGGIWPAGVSLVGQGVVSGGTTGQALLKASNDDYDTEWTTILIPKVIDKTAANISGTSDDFYVDLSADNVPAFPTVITVYIKINTSPGTKYQNIAPVNYDPEGKLLHGMNSPTDFPDQLIKICIA